MRNRSNEKLISVLKEFSEKFSGWDAVFSDPWEKERPYALKSNVVIRSTQGVYMLSDSTGPYYIGKALPTGGLMERLKRKLSNDIGTSYEDRYLRQYRENESELHVLATGSKWADIAEAILIGLHDRVGNSTLHNVQRPRKVIISKDISKLSSDYDELIEGIVDDFCLI